MAGQAELNFEENDELGGFRLFRFEMLNWGTFDKKVHVMMLNGENTLLTGEIGSGKSTIVDALTTLLVPPQQLAYNKAAGAESKERTLRSYVEGYYKSAREVDGGAARRIGLRRAGSYSVLLGYFHNQSLNVGVTLAQVFWIDAANNQPAKIYAFCERPLSIREDFCDFGSEMKGLRKKLRDTGVSVCETYREYQGKYMRAFGIRSEQAVNLFNQTVSMKTVGDLTGFVRIHILEKFDVAERIRGLLAHFDDLSAAHSAVVEAKEQLAMLKPLRDGSEQYAAVVDEYGRDRAAQNALDCWLGTYRMKLLEERFAALTEQAGKLMERLAAISAEKEHKTVELNSLTEAIGSEGGGRIQLIEGEIRNKSEERARRKKNAENYDDAAAKLSLSVYSDADSFVENKAVLPKLREEIRSAHEKLEHHYNEIFADKRKSEEELAECRAEIDSLRGRMTNIDARSVALRRTLAENLSIDENVLPFAGELIEVRRDEARWEGAAERLLRSFALSMLVPERLYKDVSEWVDGQELKGRLVYFRVNEDPSAAQRIAARSLAGKLVLKEDSPFFRWLRREIASRFDYICCENVDEFRREQKAVTVNGQIKSNGKRHEKDDRYKINDRSRYVLGWDNAGKIELLKQRAEAIENEVERKNSEINKINAERRSLEERARHIERLAYFEAFREIDWRTPAREVHELEESLEALKASSHKLQALKERQELVKKELKAVEAENNSAMQKQGENNEKLQRCRIQIEVESANVTEELLAEHRSSFVTLEKILEKKCKALQPISLDNSDSVRKTIYACLSSDMERLNEETKKLERSLTLTMAGFKNKYILAAQDFTTDIKSLSEYLALLARLEGDDLPRFESKFNDMLKDKTIQEIASFHSNLKKSGRDITERIASINKALSQIEYNPGHYIALEAEPSRDSEIRQFQNDLRECTRDAVAGESKEYTTEARFSAIEKILARFRGRSNFSAYDQQWTKKVTDVRNWYAFAASERQSTDGKETEHYSDSSGKSGGQKEKLAYTILAAGLAYQFGLNANAARARTFRFVIIDEAFVHGSDDSARFALELFRTMNLQLLIVTPKQKIHVIEPYVSSVAFVSNRDGSSSSMTNMTIEEYHERKRKISALDDNR